MIENIAADPKFSLLATSEMEFEMIWLSLKKPRFWGLHSETQVSDLEALRLFRRASRMNLEEMIERPEAAISFMTLDWGFQATPEEYLFRWDVSERVYMTLLAARMWRYVLKDAYPKRGWRLENFAAGRRNHLRKVGARRLRKLIKPLHKEWQADPSTYPWWVLYDLGVEFYRDWLKSQMMMMIRIFVEKELAAKK